MSTVVSNNPDAPPTVPTDASLAATAEGGYVLATHSARLGAALLDGLVALAATAPGLILMLATSKEGELPVLGYILMAIGLLASTFYQWYLTTQRGQTIGKKQLNIKIVPLDGAPLSFLNGVVLRSWLMGLLENMPMVGGIIFLVNILMIFGSERRCMHDHLAGTRVIDASAETF